MSEMTQTPAHAKPVPRRDHSWVLAVIAACCLIKVWPSWVGIGAEAGFPKIARMTTDWTLAVVIEAYWAYAVYAWLAAVGRRSRRFAMWSAAGVFILSVVGQSAAPVMAATAVKVFANALPVIVLALIAVLVHLRHLDRAEWEAGEQERREAVPGPIPAPAPAAPEKRSPQPAPKRSRPARRSAPADDLTLEARALGLLGAHPEMSGAALGRELGVHESYGRKLRNRLAPVDDSDSDSNAGSMT